MKSLSVSIHTTPRPPTDADIKQHSSIRLDALRTDPDSFASTYAREAMYGHAEWRGKLEQEGAWTFYAKYDEVNDFDDNWTDQRSRRLLDHVSTAEVPRARVAAPEARTQASALSSYVPAEGRSNRGSDAHISSTSPNPWLATLTLLSPSFLTSFPATSCTTPKDNSSSTPSWPFSLLGPETNLWLIVGLWVRPEWRRQRIGQQIVQRAVHFVKTYLSQCHLDGATRFETSASDTSQSPNSKSTLILLQVFARNTAAVELYRTAGFHILSNPDQTEPVQCQTSGECEMERKPIHWMGYHIPPSLPPRSNL